MAVLFYSDRAEYGGFSNFSKHGFELGGKFWKTSEHYFQAMKFAGTPHEERVRLAPSPMDAAKLGRDRSLPLRPDWEAVKDDVMRAALAAKFAAHPDLRELLLSTGEEEIVENAPGDFYWGCGKDGSGKNMLGKLLVELRTALRAESRRQGDAPKACTPEPKQEGAGTRSG